MVRLLLSGSPVICAAAALEAAVDQTIHYEDTSCAGAVAAIVIRQGKIARNRNGNCTPYAACRAIVFLVIAIIAALFGFGVIARCSRWDRQDSVLHLPRCFHYQPYFRAVATRNERLGSRAGCRGGPAVDPPCFSAIGPLQLRHVNHRLMVGI